MSQFKCVEVHAHDTRVPPCRARRRNLISNAEM
uniref:Uncharacterized protein n=1 Tax=Anopheles quadriannulatus TaxID=34691 RepID=A0A182XRW6_ANOQN